MIVRTLLRVLRQKLTGVARRIRGLALRFARRSQPVKPVDSAMTARLQSTSAPPPAPVAVTPTKPSASSGTEDAGAQRIAPGAPAAEGAAPDGSGRRHAVAMGAQNGQSEARAEEFRPENDAAAEAAVIDRGRLAPEGQAPPSDDAPPDEVKIDAPSAATALLGAEQGAAALGRESEFVATGEDDADLTFAADTDRGAPDAADAEGQATDAEHAPEDQAVAEDKPDADVEHEHIDADRKPVDRGKGPHIAEAAAGIDADSRNAPECCRGAQEDDRPEIDEETVDRGPDLHQSQPPERRRRARIDNEIRDRSGLVSAPPIEDVDYRLWNRALATHCLLVDEGDEALYLTITPTILAAALCELQPGRLLPVDAEAAFVRSVAAVYLGRVLGHRQRLRVLRRCGPDGLPDCIAFLAASVLAAYQMRSDEEATANAYYARLADLLKCDLAGGHPRGFDPDEFEALWRFLEAWLRTEKGRRLAVPGPDVGFRRFVALPLTHVPLRRVDIERLPEFFDWAGYKPGARIARSRLDQDLARWSLGRSLFTNAGMAALADERRHAVLAQVAHELESWDGSHTDSLGRRSGRVEILLDIVQRRPELSYLPRRPAAFPQVFDDGVHAFEASDEGWYDPVPIRSEDGRDLAEGFEWQVVTGRLRLVLRRAGARAIALPASHEYTGYLSHRALQLGAPGAALCSGELAESAAEYLSAISGQRCVPLNHPGLPDGWRLFTGIKPQRRDEAPPAGLEALAVEAAVDLIPTGGLRLGSRWAWLAGAPPRLIVAGLEVGERVTIDGEPVAVAEDGTLAGDGHLARPGTHIIEAAGLRRRVEIMEPEVRGRSPERETARTAVALPRGSWTLLGATPGEVAVPAFGSRAGTVALCAFPAVWAVESGAGPGARVLSLSAEPLSPSRVPRFAAYGTVGRGLQAWASAVYSAAIRRPHMETLNGQACRPEARSVWAEYAQAARDIKRQFRRARR